MVKTPLVPTLPTRTLTPLWVISLFISLTETVLGIAAVKTIDGVQIALVAFVMVFPVLVATAFFLLLWFKPHHLYAPGEYHQTPVADFVNAITRPRAPSGETAAAILLRFWKPDGVSNDRRHQAQLREWLRENGLGTVSLALFIKTEELKTARQKAVNDLRLSQN